jgi:aryl-alcohol dehydrogenase-like predicted oxidoreductase
MFMSTMAVTMHAALPAPGLLLATRRFLAPLAEAPRMPQAKIATRPLGSTGRTATLLGLGGEGVLRTFGYDRQAADVIGAALDEGVTYCDSARAYAGSEAYYGSALGKRRDQVFLTSKSHDRDKRGALAMLDQTLSNMRIEHLDLWQLHDVRTWEEIDAIGAPGGTFEAFDEAKRAGKARFIGVTGHHDTEVLLAAIARFPFDTVLLPVNPAEPSAGAFVDEVVPEAIRRGMGVVAMKILCRGLLAKMPDPPSTQELFDYALSQPVSLAIVGCDDVDQVRHNAAAARAFAPMSVERQRALEARVRPWASKLLYYRPAPTTAPS